MSIGHLALAEGICNAHAPIRSGRSDEVLRVVRELEYHDLITSLGSQWSLFVLASLSCIHNTY